MQKEFETKYSAEKEIGDGGSGRVYLGRRRSDSEPVIIKQVPKRVRTRYDEDGSPIEIGMLTRLKDVDGICRILEWFDLRGEYRIIMEETKNSSDLFKFIEDNDDSLSEETAVTIFKNLVDIAIELDNRNLVHRDLKPENLLVDKTTLKVTLIDFDTCTFKPPGNEPFKNVDRSSLKGTDVFYPPEWYIERECRPEPMTVWSLGLILHCMLKGDVPFLTEYDIENSPLVIPEDVSTFVKILLGCTLAKDVELRYTFKELKAALEM